MYHHVFLKYVYHFLYFWLKKSYSLNKYTLIENEMCNCGAMSYTWSFKSS